MLVSHDREFVDNSATECWIYEGDGVINSYVGGYHDAQHQRRNQRPIRPAAATENKPAAQPKAEPAKRTANKLSYNQQRELEQLPAQISALEEKISALQQQMSDANFFTLPHEETQQVLNAFAAAEQELEQAFERWEALEAQKNG
jgi:ATP-binding cassette subfamily F protein uup